MAQLCSWSLPATVPNIRRVHVERAPGAVKHTHPHCVSVRGRGLGRTGSTPYGAFMTQQANANPANAARESLICRNQLWSSPPCQSACGCHVIVLSSETISSESTTKPDGCVRLPFITFANVITVPAGQRERELCVRVCVC